MSGDHTRFTFAPKKRYNAVLQQQGRVQLDADFNEAEAITRRRTTLQALDLFGPVGVPALTTPDAFKVTPLAGPPGDLGLGVGRIYLDGIMAEILTEDAATYLKQPFLPDPPPLPAGDAVVLLDVWEREVTWVQDPSLLDPALGGVDTTTRLQTVWQVKLLAQKGAACGATVGTPPSGGRLTSSAVAPPAADDPCILPPVAGYRGLENRLYRVEVQAGGALGTARFKWSRDNGSIVSTVGALTVTGGQTTLTLDRIGRDAVRGFVIGNWVTLTDDIRELMGERGEMARVVAIQPATLQVVLDRALPSAGGRAFGANTTELAARHTRLQRWDQSAAVNTVDADGLMVTGAGPVALEDGVEIAFSLDPVGGVFNDGDWWAFWARTATASVEILTRALPRGILHHYVQLAAVSGLGGPAPTATDCRPAPPKAGAEPCCCTEVVPVGGDIQKAIDSLPDAGGCVCLKTGLHVIRQTLQIARPFVRLTGESRGTQVVMRGEGPVLTVGSGMVLFGITIDGIDFVREAAGGVLAVVVLNGLNGARMSDCSALAPGAFAVAGVQIGFSTGVTLAGCTIAGVTTGVHIGAQNADIGVLDNRITTMPLDGKPAPDPFFGVVADGRIALLRIEANTVTGFVSSIVVNETPGAVPQPGSTEVTIRDNIIVCGPVPAAGAVISSFGIDCAAGFARIEDNHVTMSEGAVTGRIGIRAIGEQPMVRGNEVVVLGFPPGLGPIGIQVGFTPSTAREPTNGPRVEGNSVRTCPVGIIAIGVIGGSITGNWLQFGASAAGTMAGTPTGISLDKCGFVQVSDNDVTGFSTSILSGNGIGNRIESNTIGAGGSGVLLAQEAGPVVTGNRITGMAGFGIGAGSLSGGCEIGGNQLSNCAQGADGLAAVAIIGVGGILRVRANQITDTGVAPSGVNAAPRYGIGATFVQEAMIEGNWVGYLQPEKRDTRAEDRALLLGGLIQSGEAGAFGAAGGVASVGYPALITGNDFNGVGKTALVELLESAGNSTTMRRFERVTFSNNICWHLLDPNSPENGATVKLKGVIASVSGNQIKASRPFHCVDFNGMPGPFIGNTVVGPTLLHTDLPSPPASFNLFV